VKKLSKRQREIQEEHRWYERNFPDPEMKKKRSPMWLMEIDIRDTKILAQRREIRRLRRRLEAAKAEFAEMKAKRDALEVRYGAKWAGKVPDLLDDIVVIAPKDAPWPKGDVLPKVKSNHVYHEWVTDVLKPITEQHVGWWWRKPWAWLLKMFRKEGSGW
jgi:hypothetical protein